MSKMAEFYAKVSDDEKLLAKGNKILDGTEVTEATDAQLLEIGKLAKEAGFDFTLEEVKGYLASGELDLGDESLGDVAGGGDTGKHTEMHCDGAGAGLVNNKK